MVQIATHFYYYKDDEWFEIPNELVKETGFHYEINTAIYEGVLEQKEDGIAYELKVNAPYRTKLKMELEVLGEEDYFHLIPCNIYGSNNENDVRPGEFPLLTNQYQGIRFCSPYWEFRADRAAMPMSILCCRKGAIGVSIDPYATCNQETIRNGVFAKLPNCFGVTLGYTNVPVTVKNKTVEELSIGDSAHVMSTKGTIYQSYGSGRLEAHKMIALEYEKRHTRAVYKKTLEEAAKAMFESFVSISWNEEDQEYTNKHCRVPDNLTLRPWRNVTEIGWTGGSILAYPLILCKYLLPGVTKESFQGALTGEGIIDRIIDGYCEESGLFYDLTSVTDSGSRVNGWWTGYGLVKDCHCAYNVGSALHYILKTILFFEQNKIEYPTNWYEVSKKVMDTVIQLQREDGAFGYTYSITEKEVLDWDGFAGCWFSPCAAYFYQLSGEEKYLTSAKKALYYYSHQVKELNCWGTPMDTWKSVDQEGNLAFIRGCRIVHEITKDPEILDLLKVGANYEYLWRYGYQTKPDYAPLNDGWNACGGSVTSVSNPHIHPMGVLVDEDLRYLSKVTNEKYHESRAEDSIAWLMQTLELYPEKTGYGRYGILSERWCPSDGLTVERYSDGRYYSSWFSYNLWAAANALEAVCERMIEENRNQ